LGGTGGTNKEGTRKENEEEMIQKGESTPRLLSEEF